MKSLVCGETGVGCRCGFETRQFCYQESWLDYGQITTIKETEKLFFFALFFNTSRWLRRRANAPNDIDTQKNIAF